MEFGRTLAPGPPVGLEALKGRLAKGTEDARRLVSLVRPTLSQEQQGKLLRWILSRPQIAKRVVPPERQPLAALFSSRPLRPIDLTSELRWTTELVVHHTPRLATFIGLCDRYYSSI